MGDALVCAQVDYEMAGKDLIEFGQSLGRDHAARSAARRRKGSTMNCSSTKRAKNLEVEGQWPDDRRMARLCEPRKSVAFHVSETDAAKRLYFDVIPRTVDDYLAFSTLIQGKRSRSVSATRLAYSFGRAAAPRSLARAFGSQATLITFGMLLKPCRRSEQRRSAVLWGFLRRYAPDVSAATHPRLDRLVAYAVRYFRDFVRPAKNFREPDEIEREALEKLSAALCALPPDASAEAIQTVLYDVARKLPRYQDMKAKGATAERPGVSNDWFTMLYGVLLGESRGPRFGSFVALYGIAETRKLIADALSGDLKRQHAAYLS